MTLSPPLAEWLDERASALGIEREALLVELLGTHRSTAEIGNDGLVSLLESVDAEAPTPEPALEDIDDRVGTIEERLDGIDDRTGNVDSRVDDVEAKLVNNVEDIHRRVLQLRDALEERAPAEHSHGEFEAVSDRLDAVSAELEAIDEGPDRRGTGSKRSRGNSTVSPVQSSRINAARITKTTRREY